MSSYACSSKGWNWDSGNWNGGQVTFKDPLTRDSDYVITQASITLWGLLTCSSLLHWQTELAFYLNGNLLTDNIEITVM